VYLNHIYQLAASARSVVAENKALHRRLETLQQAAGGGLVRSQPLFCSGRGVVRLTLGVLISWWMTHSLLFWCRERNRHPLAATVTRSTVSATVHGFTPLQSPCLLPFPALSPVPHRACNLLRPSSMYMGFLHALLVNSRAGSTLQESSSLTRMAPARTCLGSGGVGAPRGADAAQGGKAVACASRAAARARKDRRKQQRCHLAHGLCRHAPRAVRARQRRLRVALPGECPR
jgi:hypothetical protein